MYDKQEEDETFILDELASNNDPIIKKLTQENNKLKKEKEHLTMGLAKFCRCFSPGGSHQRVNLYACSLSRMVMQEDTEIYHGSGKRRPYVQRGERVCIILHLSACTGANTSVV